MYDPDATLYRQQASEIVVTADKIRDLEQRRVLLSIALIYHQLAKSFEGDSLRVWN